MYLFHCIASACQARRNCIAGGNTEWADRWTAYLDRIERECLPSGSGFDAGTSIDREKSGPNQLVFDTSFHHMDDGGYYDGWTRHAVTIAPTFNGPIVKVGGRNRNDVKDYIGETFAALDDTAVPFNP